MKIDSYKLLVGKIRSVPAPELLHLSAGEERWHAVFSPSCAARHGSSIYRREDGSSVEITCVFKDPKFLERYNWPDTEYVGIVTRWARVGQAGETNWAYERRWSNGR